MVQSRAKLVRMWVRKPQCLCGFLARCVAPPYIREAQLGEIAGRSTCRSGGSVPLQGLSSVPLGYLRRLLTSPGRSASMVHMAHTTRTHMTEANRREVRRGRATQDRARRAEDSLHRWSYPLYRRLWEEVVGTPWGTRHTRGGMLMSSRNTGLWNDERCNAREKRSIKRSQRHKVRRDIEEQL